MDAALSTAYPYLAVITTLVSVFYLFDGFRRRNVGRMAASLFGPAALLLLLQVQTDGAQARLDLLENAADQRSEAAIYLDGALAAIEEGGDTAITSSIDLLQLSQATNAVATQASIAEAQTRVATADSLLTTLLVAITLYAAWQTRLAVTRSPATQAPAPAATPEIVLVVPRRFAGMRRWLRLRSDDTEQVSL